MIEQFPVVIASSTLTVQDFTLFSKSFEDILKASIPTAEKILFLTSSKSLMTKLDNQSGSKELLDVFDSIRKSQLQFTIHEDLLFIGFPVALEEVVVGVIHGADQVFLRRVREDWLQKAKINAEREFILLKQARTDAQTGLLNLANLSFLLERKALTTGLQLVLVELPSMHNSFQKTYLHIIRCTVLLKAFLPSHIQLHYLGQTTFGLLFLQDKVSALHDIESNLVAYLKKEGCRKVHVGSSVWQPKSSFKKENSDGSILLDEAWTALRCAQRRGAFSFCEYHRLAFPEEHPLASPDKTLVRRLRQLWAHCENFSLVCFRNDLDDQDVSESICSELAGQKTVTAMNEVYVVCQESRPLAIRSWVKDVIGRVKDRYPAISVSSGISCYPYSNFRKSEMVLNCRKALLHGDFFGPGSVVVFDALSLNISGDVYFSDGDFTGAIKEYRRGILCGADVNLYNSLGVTLAMMGRINKALESFNAALDLQEDNFMALYNLGLVYQAKNDLQKSWHYFGLAYKVSDQEEIEPEIVNDLKLQFGIISAEIGQYREALSSLQSWLQVKAKTSRAGRVYYSLGKSYYGLGEMQEAMSMFQKALVYDEFDDQSMSLLGKIYLDEQQGLEIALSLCRKSVDLDPENLQHKIYLAEVLIACDQFTEAKVHLQRCLRNRQVHGQAQFLMGLGYESLGQQKRASGWYNKVKSRGDVDEKTMELVNKKLILQA